MEVKWASRLREERQSRGWSLTKLTLMTGISSSDISMVERRLRPCYPGWQRRLAHAFKLPVERLFDAEYSGAKRDNGTE